MILKTILFLVTLLYSSVFAVDYIAQQDLTRCQIFNEKRSEEQARPFTRNISKKLTDPIKIDYRRTATLEDREVIYKAIIGGVIIHNREESLYIRSTSSAPPSRYEAHVRAIQQIEKSAQLLWKGVQNSTYIVSLDQISQENTIKSLLTKHFVKWFYETLEAYKHELNFFSGAATLEWFQQARNSYAQNKYKEYDLGKEYSSSRRGIVHYHILDDQGNKVAVLKPKPENFLSSDGSKPSDRRNDWIVSLCAKSIGLSGVYNPAIPVRMGEDNTIIIDPKRFTHILEPFAGINRGQLSKSPMQDLINHVLGAEEKRQTGPSFELRQKMFASYFEDSKYKAPQRFKDLTTFNNALPGDMNIVKLLAFWYIFQIKDMHNGNLLWTLNAQGGLAIVCIDYNLAWNSSFCDFQEPPLTLLKQATFPISQKSVKFIQELSLESLCHVLETYQYPLESTIDLSPLQSAFAKRSSLRQVIYNLTRLVGEKERKFLTQAGKDYTPYDALEVRPYGKSHPDNFSTDIFPFAPLLTGYKPIKLDSDGTHVWNQVRHVYDWVFSVESEEDLEQGKFVKSTPFPGYYMWRYGHIPFNLVFGSDYLKLFPQIDGSDITSRVYRK